MNQADSSEDFANLMEELNNYTTENHTENANSSNQASEVSSAIDLSNLDASPADSNQPVTIAPSADFASSMNQTATTSAAAKDSDNLATPSHTLLSPLMNLDGTENIEAVKAEAAKESTSDDVDFTKEDQAEDAEKTEHEKFLEDQEKNPLKAADPVPGSIGSAVSYHDYEKEKNEEVTKAQNPEKKSLKLDPKMIAIIAIAGICVIFGAIFLVNALSNQPKKSSRANNQNTVVANENQILECATKVSEENRTKYNAASGEVAKIFTYSHDSLSSIEIRTVYEFSSTEAAKTAKQAIDSENQLTENNGRTEKTENHKTITSGLDGKIISLSVTVKSEDLEAYQKTDDFKNQSFATADSDGKLDLSINNVLTTQNLQGFSCSITEQKIQKRLPGLFF